MGLSKLGEEKGRERGLFLFLLLLGFFSPLSAICFPFLSSFLSLCRGGSVIAATHAKKRGREGKKRKKEGTDGRSVGRRGLSLPTFFLSLLPPPSPCSSSKNPNRLSAPRFEGGGFRQSPPDGRLQRGVRGRDGGEGAETPFDLLNIFLRRRKKEEIPQKKLNH